MKQVVLLGCGLGALLVLGAGCGAKTDSAAATPAAAETPATAKPPPASTKEEWTGEQLAFIKEKFGELQSTPTGLLYRILQPGQGEERPPRGKLCTVHYRGTFLDGKVFDESYRRGEPFKFRVGVKQVIAGWDESVATMRKGEKRLIVVPYWLGYGAQGKIPYIMPRTTLVFEIELLDWAATSAVPSGQ